MSTENEEPPMTAGMKALVQVQQQLYSSEQKNALLQSEIKSIKAEKEKAETLHKVTVENLSLEAEATQLKLTVLEQYFVELNKNEEMKRNTGADGATKAEDNASMITLDKAYVAELKADVERFRDASDEYKKQLEDQRKTSEEREVELQEQVEIVSKLRVDVERFRDSSDEYKQQLEDHRQTFDQEQVENVAELKAEIEQLRNSSDYYKKQFEDHRKTSDQRDVELQEQVEKVTKLKLDVELYRNSSDEYKEQLENHCRTSEQRELELQEQVEDLKQRLSCREATIDSLESSLTQLREGFSGRNNKARQQKKGEVQDDGTAATDLNTSISSCDDTPQNNVVSDDIIAAAVYQAINKERLIHKKGVESLKDKVRQKFRSKDSTIAKLKKQVKELEMEQSISELERGFSPSNSYRGGMSPSFSFSSMPDQFDLRSVKVTNEMIDDSVKRLEAIMKKISHNEERGESKQEYEAGILAASEKISLVQIELQASVKLLEFRMKNQLENQRDEAANKKLKNPALVNETGQPSSEEGERQEGVAQDEKKKEGVTLNAVQMESIENKIQEVKDDTMREIQQLESTIEEKITEMKDKTCELEKELETRSLDEAKQSTSNGDYGFENIFPEFKDEDVDNDNLLNENEVFPISMPVEQARNQDDQSWTRFDDKSVFTAQSEDSAWSMSQNASFDAAKFKTEPKQLFRSNDDDSSVTGSVKSSSDRSGSSVPPLPKMKQVRNPLRATFRSKKKYASMKDDVGARFSEI
uniref:Uncharacterized protein n=1 Tax=Ditylum brightwellii TaxID=49249 RepID=A0A7S1ZT89_9STRA|mmetsp:Transcript_38392/g.57519  ORF Transcript_38392/g.57519 Transcript_38392/m.57519 type:complete len:756 (+) Transcript_38392:71-2338(+)